jgi:hypothetical protein
MSSIRFYNPGTKIDEMLRYDNPTTDPAKQNNIAYYRLQVDKASFFEVPTEQVIESPEMGELRVPVGFGKRVKETFKDYGVVQIDPRKKPDAIHEDDNLAANEKDAKEKGTRMWRDFLMKMAREHITNCEQARAAGGFPMRAKGLMKHALDELGIEDPADKVGVAVDRKQDSDEMAELKKQIAELTRLVKKNA